MQNAEDHPVVATGGDSLGVRQCSAFPRLTFDDGPGPSTEALLDVLWRAGRTATFFVLGRHAAQVPDVLKRMLADGHELGNHTWTHAHAGQLSDEELEAGIRATDHLIVEAHRALDRPVPASIPLRLPYGLETNDPRERVLLRLERQHVGWTSLFEDWVAPPPSPHDLAERMRKHVVDQAARGLEAVLCLHDASPRREPRSATVAAVELWLRDQAH